MTYEKTAGKPLTVTIILGGHGGDMYYEMGLVSGLVKSGLNVEIIGGERILDNPIAKDPRVRALNLRGSQDPEAPLLKKAIRIFLFYYRLFRHGFKSDSRIFHIQWFNKFWFIDRIVLNIYYKVVGKRIVYTAHNVDAGERDGNNSFYNKITLKIMYHLVDHIIVHTDKMKNQVIQWFNVDPKRISVVPHGINDQIPKRGMSRTEARGKLGIDEEDKCLLFFGFIAPYKGLDVLIEAFVRAKKHLPGIKIIVAGNIKNREANSYWGKISDAIKREGIENDIYRYCHFIKDEDIEPFFAAADVLVLPYRYIFQSGILFLAMNFGLPVIATDVGSLREYIKPGETGFLCRPGEPEDLAEAIVRYFHSDLYRELDHSRKRIFESASSEYSWERIGRITSKIYNQIR